MLATIELVVDSREGDHVEDEESHADADRQDEGRGVVCFRWSQDDRRRLP